MNKQQEHSLREQLEWEYFHEQSQATGQEHSTGHIAPSVVLVPCGSCFWPHLHPHCSHLVDGVVILGGRGLACGSLIHIFFRLLRLFCSQPLLQLALLGFCVSLFNVYISGSFMWASVYLVTPESLVSGREPGTMNISVQSFHSMSVINSQQ